MDERLSAKHNPGHKAEMHDDELHAELDRQLAEEKQQEDKRSVSGLGSSKTAIGYNRQLVIKIIKK